MHSSSDVTQMLPTEATPVVSAKNVLFYDKLLLCTVLELLHFCVFSLARTSPHIIAIIVKLSRASCDH